VTLWTLGGGWRNGHGVSRKTGIRGSSTGFHWNHSMGGIRCWRFGGTKRDRFLQNSSTTIMHSDQNQLNPLRLERVFRSGLMHQETAV
jgi:hypothetical protein